MHCSTVMIYFETLISFRLQLVPPSYPGRCRLAIVAVYNWAIRKCPPTQLKQFALNPHSLQRRTQSIIIDSFLAAIRENESYTCVLGKGCEKQHGGVFLLCAAACRKCWLMWSGGLWAVWTIYIYTISTYSLYSTQTSMLVASTFKPTET